MEPIQQQIHPEPPKRKVFPFIFWILLIVFLVLLGMIFAKAYNLSAQVFSGKVSFFQRVERLIFNRGSVSLTGEEQGQINVLLLGYGGPGHDGPFLTDTLMLASVNLDTKQVLLTSVPRDFLWIAPDGSQQKINFAFATGVARNGHDSDFEQGGALARQAVSDLSGMSIPYYVSVDFQGFVDAINRVGGLDVNVDKTFTDAQFPRDGTTGYLPPQTFTAGQHHFDGETALIYARSRHGNNDEGSDFARSKRQQKIINAFVARVNSLNLVNNASTFNDLLSILASHLHTNLEPDELLHLATLVKENNFKAISQSLDDSGGLVCDKLLDNGPFVVEPCEGVQMSKIRSFFQNGFQFAGINEEHASVIIEDMGTDHALYNETKNFLTQAGVTVYEVPYRGAPLQNSVLYEVDSKPATEALIEKRLKITHQPKPAKLKAASDLVLMIGGSAAQ